MTCKEALVELVECARQDDRGIHAEPGRDLRAHLANCGACSERWEAERQLTAHLGEIRNQAARLRSPAARREALLRDFTRINAPLPVPGVRMRYARWGLAAAAGLVCVVALGHQAGLQRRAPLAAARERGGVRTQPAVLYESNALSTDASTLSSDDFVAIPYTPPLAPGEMVRIVRADMYPEALAGMGVEIDMLAWAKATDVPVEMVVGEDGIPRAVRITDSN
jgi:hypothetical protein